MNVSCDKDYELTLEYAYDNKSEQELSAERALFGFGSGGFDKKDNLKKQKTSPLTPIFNWYNKSNIKPYVKTRDFNSQGQDQYHIDDNAPKPGIEIGFSFRF